MKKYPGKPRETILRDLVASLPGNEGKWYAAVKDAGFFSLAIELANQSLSDPRTLTRAAKDYAVERPRFALAAGITALRGIADGWGYDINGVDVLDAYFVVMAAAGAAGLGEAVVSQGGCAGADCCGPGWGRVCWARTGTPVDELRRWC